jgi:hypothetical protein
MPFPSRFPALSVRQPWADLIMIGEKDVENRSRRTRFRGTILLHASAAKPKPELAEAFRSDAAAAGWIKKNEPWEFDLGAILGTIDILDCVQASSSRWFSGPFGWILANAKPFDDVIPFKGAVGIFYVPIATLDGSPAAQMQPDRAHEKQQAYPPSSSDHTDAGASTSKQQGSDPGQPRRSEAPSSPMLTRDIQDLLIHRIESLDRLGRSVADGHW